VRSNVIAAVAVLVLLSALAIAVYAVVRLRARRAIATASQRATYDVLHLAGIAADPLRGGLTAANAGKAIRPLRRLTGSAGLAVVDAAGMLLAYDGAGSHHRDQAQAAGTRVLATARATVLGARDLTCDQLECTIRGAVAVPLVTPSHGGGAGAAVGALVALSDGPPAPGLVQATIETATWTATQIALAELESSRERLARAEVRALRAQISPHFIYNALSAIASFVRTDPVHARALILDFAEFTRYSFRAHGEFTTLAEELHSIDRYLTIERARFGERLDVRLQIAPEVLPVTIPYLCLQPLVENAVRHGLSGKTGVGTVTIVARDAGAHCQITVEDDGVGMDPDALGQTGAGDEDAAHVGLTNVDERLRSVFGDEFGLVVETAPGAGTKVSVRVPKFHPGVRPSQPAAPPAAPPPGLRVPT
jgi:two-component system LytT family sensor kinase